MTKRTHGDGSIDQRGENSFRLRYRISKKRYQKTFHGTLAEARRNCGRCFAPAIPASMSRPIGARLQNGRSTGLISARLDERKKP